MFAHLMNQLKINRAGPGRPRTRPDRVRGDKAYSSRAIRTHLRDRGIVAVIPQPSDQIGHRKRRGSTVAGPRPPASTKRTTRAKRRRAELQHLQAMASPGNPLRQTCPHLPRRSGPPSNQHLADSLRRHALEEPASGRTRTSGIVILGRIMPRQRRLVKAERFRYRACCIGDNDWPCLSARSPFPLSDADIAEQRSDGRSTDVETRLLGRTPKLSHDASVSWYCPVGKLPFVHGFSAFTDRSVCGGRWDDAGLHVDRSLSAGCCR